MVDKNMVYDINMVAKHKTTATTNNESLGEINMMDNPPGLPPGLEQGIIDYINNGIANGITNATAQMNIDMQTLAKRLDDNASGHFKSLQTQITDLDNKINALNAKVDGTKTAQDINDDYIKTEVNKHVTDILNNISQHEQSLQMINSGWSDMNNKLDTLGTTVYNIQSRAITGDGGHQGIRRQPLMNHRVVTNLDKLTNDASDFHMWNLRLKNALNQIDPSYKTAIIMIERAPDSILTYDACMTVE